MGLLLAGRRRGGMRLGLAAALLAAACLLTAASGTQAAGGATASVRSVATDGQWPGVGRICEPGPGGAGGARGVGPKSIDIAVFNDQSNSVLPGLEKEFVQFAGAFAAWCNASGGIDGRHIVIDDRVRGAVQLGAGHQRGLPERLHGRGRGHGL